MTTPEQNKCSGEKGEEQTTEVFLILFASTLIRPAESHPAINPQIGSTIENSL